MNVGYLVFAVPRTIYVQIPAEYEFETAAIAVK